MESALKMKEVSYLHAEGIPSGFLKHGTLAMIDSNFVCFFFLPAVNNKKLYSAAFHAVEEVKSRSGRVIGFASPSDSYAIGLLDDYIPLPDTDLSLNPYIEMLMAQLFSYYTALKLKRNIDMPRNLAKSVTVP